MPIKKFANLSPDPDLGKSKSDNAIAKLGHLNRLVKDVNQALASAGGGGGLVETTDAGMQTLINSNSLKPGTLYKVTGFNKNMPSGSPRNPNSYLPEVLFDDGTDSGITIYAQAITTNKLSSNGWGEFYNPKYNDLTTYYDTGGVGLYGIWDGDNPNEGSIPTYAVDQVVFWGGYAWKNLTGNVGVSNDAITLGPEDWEKIPYSNTTYYEKVIDEIKIDWHNGIIVGRTNVENQITVEFNADQYYWWMGIVYTNVNSSPISTMGWGLYSKITPEGLDNEFCGISNISVINSVCETVNFKGVVFANATLRDSYLGHNYFGKDVTIDTLKMEQYATFDFNSFREASLYETVLTDSAFRYNTFYQCYITSNTITLGTFNNNNFTGLWCTNNSIHSSQMSGNSGEQGATMNYNVLNSNSNITNNVVSSGSQISQNTLESGSYIANNALSDSSYINYNTLSQNSSIDLNNLVLYSNVNNNNVSGQSFIQSNTITSSFLRNNTLNGASSIATNTLDKNEWGDPSQIENNNLNFFSTITYNNLSYSYISNNHLAPGKITSNNISNGGAVHANIIKGNISTDAGITNFYSDASTIVENTIQSSVFDMNSVLLSYKHFAHIIANYANVSGNFSTATIITSPVTSKQVFRNSNSETKLSYYNSSNVLTVVDITA